MPPFSAIVDCPLLASHGAHRANLALLWNVPMTGIAAVDVVLHFHGFQPVAQFTLAGKVAVSGLEFADPGKPTNLLRTRPTIGIVPMGRAVDDHRRDFPALASASQVEALLAFALEQLVPQGSARIARRILTAHSGGGAAVEQLLGRGGWVPDEVHLFDALYSDPLSITNWALAHAVERNVAIAAASSPVAAVGHIREGGGAVRAICLRGQTQQHTSDLAHTIASRVAASPTNIAAIVGGYCRAELAPGDVSHEDVPRRYGWQLLADASTDLHPPVQALPLPTSLPIRHAAALLAELEHGYDEVIPIPDGINANLSRARQATMLRAFGTPGNLTDDCSPLTNVALKRRVVTRNVGSFSLTGLAPALDAIERIFVQVRREKPILYSKLGSAGMLCCRRVRPVPGAPKSPNFSNHAWGTAVDLSIGGLLDARGDGKCLRGLAVLAPYFHAEGFYWGAGFSGGHEDSMHFELADETIVDWVGRGIIAKPDPLVAS